MNNKQLNIVITHYNEPWNLGKPFFDMLEHQQGVNMNNVAVTIVQDGEQYQLPWSDVLSQYTYDIDIVTIPHSGVATARNTAIDRCTADWIMFCNFDDMFADVCSLSMMLQNFPTTDWDLIWCKYVQQSKWFSGHIYLNKVDVSNFSTTDGKIYRTDFLREKDIRFFSGPAMHYDLMFNTVVIAEVPHFRIAELTADFYPYFKTFRPDSYRHSPEAYDERVNTTFLCKSMITQSLEKRNLDYAFKRSVASAVCSEYYSIYSPDRNEPKDYLSPGFLDFYRKYKDAFDSVSDADMDTLLSEAEVENMNIIQNRYNEYKFEYYFRNDNIPFKQWIAQLDAIHSEPSSDILYDDEPVIIDAIPDKEPHIVVYCGTYDVYINMIASLKSLLCTTPVDKVYFLTEDDKDTFPFELPDIVEIINVKNQEIFPHDGPNYDNTWTYMCMMRAIYPELFPMYHRILSLDIDVVIDDNVSDLWDYDISNYYLAGVPERQRQKSSDDPLYINFGVVMMNIDKLREDNKQDEIINLLNTQKVDCPEQGAFNRVCANHILELPADYNYTAYSHITGDSTRQRIIHYAGQKFWRHYSKVKQYADLDWNEIMRRQNALKEGE